MKFLLKIISYFSYRIFKSSLNDIEKSQELVLKKLLRESQFLTYYQTPVNSYKEFAKTPIKEYEDYADGVKKDLEGERNHSVYGRVIITEKTSGTTSGSKVIPYTSKQLSHFFSMTLIWIHDLLNSEALGLKSLKTFISISPGFDKSDHKTVNSDEEYLPWIIRLIFSKKILIPTGLRSVQDPDQYNEKLLIYLLKQKELENISIWNPNYLLSYLDLFKSRYEFFKEKSARFDLPDKYEEKMTQQIWPKVKFISVWGDSNAVKDFERLKKVFSKNIVFQKKGLLSTEFPVTIPLLEVEKGHIPLVHKVFIELKQEDRIYRLHDAKVGESYSLILSSPGGFHRYNTHDIVKVIGIHKNCPTFEFVGRDNYSDLVGEKLSEVFVKLCIEKVSPNSFTLLRAVVENDQKFYQVLTDDESLDLDALENLLKENIHYRYARNINQLKSLRVQGYSEKEFYDDQVKLGKKRGDIKRSYLLRSSF